MFSAVRKSVLLVDFDNMFVQCGRPFLDNIGNWVAWLENGEFDPQRRRRRFLAKRIYWNTENDTHRQAFRRHRFDIHLCRAIRKEKASSADFDITIDAVDLHHRKRGAQEFIILSFDTDFSSVLLHLQLEGRTGVGMIDGENLEGRENGTSKYKRLLDVAIEKQAFCEAFSYNPNANNRKRTAPRPSPAPAAPAAAPVAPKPEAARARPASPPAQRAAPATTATAKFDYAAAAQVIAQAAEKNGLVYIGKERMRQLIRHLPGFYSAAGLPWGGGSYSKALSEFVRVDPKRFYLEKTANGGTVLACRADPAAAR